MFFVVFGHFIESVKNIYEFDLIYRFIYLFHMPAFIFISGFLTSGKMNERKVNSILYTIVIPLIIFQVLFKLTSLLLLKQEFKLQLILPYWGLWYLMSLFVWRLLILFFNNLKYPLQISLVISLLAGATSYLGHEWSLSRTFAFLPFFVAGYLFREINFEGLRLPNFNFKYFFVGVVSLVLFAYFTKNINVRFLYLYSSYSSVGTSLVEGGFLRLGQILMGGIGIYCVLSLPKIVLVNNFISDLGKYSIAPYILHMFVLVVANAYGLRQFLLQQSFVVILACSFFCSLAMVFSFSFFGKKFNWIFDYSWMNLTKS